MKNYLFHIKINIVLLLLTLCFTSFSQNGSFLSINYPYKSNAEKLSSEMINTTDPINESEISKIEKNLACSMSLTGTAAVCSGSISNAYTLSGQVTFTEAPTTGTLSVCVNGGQCQVFSAPFTSPINYSLSNLYADGATRTVTASFSAINCSATLNYTASSPVGAVKNYPLNSNISSLSWDADIYFEYLVSNLHYPIGPAAGSAKYPGVIDLNISPQGTVNAAGYCVEKSQSIPSTNNNVFHVLELEKISRVDASNSSTESINIPVGGIGKVRAGMVRYLMDNYYVNEVLDGSTWTDLTAAAFAMAITEIVHESYASNNSFTLKTASTNGYYYVPTPSGTVNPAVDLAESYLQAINALNWSDNQWMSYQSTKYFPIALESTAQQDVVIGVPIKCTVAACSSTVNATPGTCNSTNNLYSVTGQITLTNPPYSGTVTVQIVGGGSQTYTLPQASPINYTISGQTADGASQKVNVSISGVSCASSVNYTAPTPCMVAACSSTVTATPGTCNTTNNLYSVTGQITLTNPPSSGTVTVQIVGGGSQTYTLPQASPINYTISGQTADGASHTVNVSISGVSCASSVNYTAPTACMVGACSSTITATPGTCNSTNNLYAVTGQITLTNPPSSGTVTVQIVGGGSQTYTLPQTSPINYTISGQTADGASHTVNVSISGVICASSVNYTAPTACMVGACSSTVTATPGTCNTTNNLYAVTGQITLTNPPSSGTVTVQIVGGGSQTYTLPQTSPINYTISGQTADGASHTVNVSISGVSCASTVNYTAPVSCSTTCQPDTIKICAGQSAEYVATDGYTNYVWYKINGPGDTVQVASGQTFTTSTIGNYMYKAIDGGGCPIKLCCPLTVADTTCCVISNLNLVIGNCDNKGTLSNASDDEYTFTLDPIGTGIGTSYTVSGLPNSPQTGIYGSPTTFGPYLISAGVLNISVSDVVSNSCSKTASVTPPPSCSFCNVSPPVLSVNDNICPNRTGTINLVQGCGAGTYIQYSINNGTTWSSVKPLYSTTPRTILARCVNSTDTTCKSPNSTITTAPKKCPNNGNECTLSANATVDPCYNNGTDNDTTDDYFTIQINASVLNGGSSNKYEVVVGADPLTGTGGNVLNSGGTNYGSPVTVGNTKIFEADGTSTYQLVVRDINNKNCFQIINIDPVASCSTAPPKSPCYPVPCVPIGLIKN